MAITFTNKAAQEMKERVDQIVGFGSESVWVTTFHSTCVRILRRYIDRIGFDNRFTIYDADDQKSLMKDICKRLQIVFIFNTLFTTFASFSSLLENYVLYVIFEIMDIASLVLLSLIHIFRT